MLSIRPITADDSAYLWRVLEIASNWDIAEPPIASNLRERPTVRLYAEGWGRHGDGGLLAATDDGDLAGACWYRLFSPGAVWGAIDAFTPVLTFGVEPSHRQKGVGTLLLRSTLTLARDSGFDRLSLSVAKQNSVAISMYERAGFQFHGEDGGSWNMVVELSGVPSGYD